MEEVDKKFSELFIVPASLGRTMSMRSQRSELKEEGPTGLQRRSSIKNRILGVFQSTKHSKDLSPESIHSLRRKSHQQVERLSTWPAGETSQSKEKAVDGEHSRSNSMLRPMSPKTRPPVSMDRYPRLRSFTSSQQDQIHTPAHPKSNPQTIAPPTTTATKPKPKFPTSTHRLSLQPSTSSRNASPVPTRTFSFSRRHSAHEDPTPAIQPVTIHPPPSLASQLFSSMLDNRLKHTKSNSTSTTGRDSKYSSSVSSLPSIQSLESTPRNSAVSSPIASMSKPISTADFAQLESIARRVERRLNQQYHQFQQLSANLVRLSGRKIHNLSKSEALLRSINLPNKPEIMAMRNLIHSTKEKVRIMFLKKSAVIQRSTMALAGAKDAISNTKRDHPEGSFVVDMEPFFRMCSILKEDIAAQRKFDRELKALLESLRKNANFQRNLRDRFEMGQFGPFVDGRLGMIEASYCKMETLCQRVRTVGI